MPESPLPIERRIRTLSERLPYCHAYGQDPEPIEQEIAALKAKLRALHGPAGAERRPDEPREHRA
jgi:hypothetical protein